MNVRVSDIAFDVNLVDVCSMNNQYLERVPQQRKADPFRRDKAIRVYPSGEAKDDKLGIGNGGIYASEIFHSKGTIFVSTKAEKRQTQVHLRSNRAGA